MTIIAGSVNADTTVRSGSGFTVELYNDYKGDYLISFDEPLGAFLGATATAIAGGSNIFVATIRTAGSGSLRVQIANLANDSVSSAFSFVVVGD